MANPKRGQLHLLENLNRYLESQEWPFRGNPDGICLGLAALRCKYVLENRENEYYEMLDILSDYDKLKENYDDKVNLFVTQALMAYQPNLFTNKKQKDALSMLKVNGKEILRVNMIAPIEEWKKTLDSLDLQNDEVMILQTPTHAMSVSRTPDGKYRLADPNHSKGFIDYNDSSLLMKHITMNYPWKGDYGLDISIVRNNESLNKPRTPPLPSKAEIYKNINIDAITKNIKSNEQISQCNFACRFDNLSLFVELLKKGAFKGDNGPLVLYEGLLTAAKNDSTTILKALADQTGFDDALLPKLVNMAINQGSYRAFTLFATHDNTKQRVQNLFTTEEASNYIHMAASGKNSDILRKIINIYTEGDNPILTPDELAQKILTKDSKNLDAIEAAIGERGHCGISNTESATILIKKVLESNQKISDEQLFNYLWLAVKTNQPHLVKLFADTIAEQFPNNQSELFKSFKLSVGTAKHTDYSILKTLEEHGTEHSIYVQGIMQEKAARPPGILLTIGIKLEKFTEWVKSITKEDNLQQCAERFKFFKQNAQELHEPIPSIKDEGEQDEIRPEF